jgi:hypothetical protein
VVAALRAYIDPYPRATVTGTPMTRRTMARRHSASLLAVVIIPAGPQQRLASDIPVRGRRSFMLTGAVADIFCFVDAGRVKQHLALRTDHACGNHVGINVHVTRLLPVSIRCRVGYPACRRQRTCATNPIIFLKLQAFVALTL